MGQAGINHVALYIGNGKIVHASTAATGIKVSVITMRHRLESEPMLNKTIKDKAPERKLRGLFFS